MKDILCCKCGESIEAGYAVNPEESAICNQCYDEEMENSELNNL